LGLPLAPFVKIGYPAMARFSTLAPFVRSVEAGGFKFFVSVLDLAVGRGLREDGFWEPVTTKLIETLLAPGMVFVDIGAQIGYHTLFAARRVANTGRVFAFEPDKRHLDLLNRNLYENCLYNVTVAPLAAFNKTGRLI
jgi:hypothetical protein